MLSFDDCERFKNQSIYEILQILLASLGNKTPVNKLLMKSDNINFNEHITDQLVFDLLNSKTGEYFYKKKLFL